MNIIQTILKTDKTSDIDSILRCIQKSDTIIFKDGMYLICNTEYIYYFGAINSSRVPSKLGKFIKQYYPIIKGKLVYSKVPELFNIKKFEVIDLDAGLYRWL